MLALADRFGEVAASVPGLAIAAHVSTDAARQAIKILESPDPDSRTPDEDGRRVTRINGGWKIVNHGKYRTLSGRDEEWQKTRAKLKQKAYRDRKRYRNAGNGDRLLPTVTTEAEAEAEAEKYKNKSKAASAFVLPEWISSQTWEDFEEMRRKVRKPMTLRARNGIIAELDRLRGAGNDPEAVLVQSITNSWQGVFELRKNGGNGHVRTNGNFQALAEYLAEIGEDQPATH